MTAERIVFAPAVTVVVVVFLAWSPLACSSRQIF